MLVMLPIGKIKKLARQMLKGKYLMALVIVFISLIIAQAPAFILGYLFSSGVLSYILDFYSIIIAGPLMLGLVYYFLELFRNSEELGIGSFTKGFSNMWNAAALFCVCLLRVILWSFLFVVPGVIAAIRYSQAFYIMADDPTLRPYQCIEKSKAMMQGNKSKFFLLELSFAPWYILLSLPSYIYLMNTVDLSAVLDMEQQVLAITKAMNQPMYILLGLLPILIRPLLATSEACFYDIASGSLQLQFDGRVPYDYDGTSRDVYEITGFESSENKDE